MAFNDLIRRNTCLFCTYSLCLLVHTYADAGVREETAVSLICDEIRGSSCRISELLLRRWGGVKDHSRQGERSFKEEGMIRKSTHGRGVEAGSGYLSDAHNILVETPNRTLTGNLRNVGIQDIDWCG